MRVTGAAAGETIALQAERDEGYKIELGPMETEIIFAVIPVKIQSCPKFWYDRCTLCCQIICQEVLAKMRMTRDLPLLTTSQTTHLQPRVCESLVHSILRITHTHTHTHTPFMPF